MNEQQKRTLSDILYDVQCGELQYEEAHGYIVELIETGSTSYTSNYGEK